MMVTFVSQCEKNALKRTRRVLDAFANRIGDNAWQTLITEDGLQTVKRMLRQTASRHTAVSCHWIRSRSRIQLLWVVGNNNKFNNEGYVPVNSTEVIEIKTDENPAMIENAIANTQNQPLEQHLFAVGWLASHLLSQVIQHDNLCRAAFIAGCLHDLGKLDPQFQAWVKKQINSRLETEIPEDGVHIEKGKFSWDKHARHNEISWLLWMLLRKEDNFDLANHYLDDYIEHAIFWHHTQPVRKEELKDFEQIQKKLAVAIEKNFKPFYQSVINTLEDVNKLAATYDPSMSLFSKSLVLTGKEAHRSNRLPIPKYKSYSANESLSEYKIDIQVNANANVIRSALIAADRLISGLSETELNQAICEQRLHLFVDPLLQKQSDLIVNIQQCLTRFNAEYGIDDERNQAQSKAAHELADIKDIAVLHGPAGVGKTKIALEWAALTEAKQIIWVCPRVQVCQGLYADLRNEYLPNVSVEICTGEFKSISQGGIETETPEGASFSGDVVLTTIDQVLNATLTHSKATALIDLLNSHVVFDEFHEYIQQSAFNLLFAELVECKKLQKISNTLLVSATPNYAYIEGVLDIHYSNVVIIRSFNKSRYDIVFKTFNDQTPPLEHPLYCQQPPNSIVITNTAYVSQLSYIQNQQYENAALFHARFKASDKKALFESIYSSFKRHGTHQYDVLRSGPIVQASLNITCCNMVSEFTSAENWLQRLGRLDRFGEYQETNTYITALPENVDLGKGNSSCTRFLSSLYSLENAKCWYQYLKDNLSSNNGVTLSELYGLYYKFYKTEYRDRLDQELVNGLKHSIKVITSKAHKPLSAGTPNKSDKKFIKRRSLRGDSRFVQMACLKIESDGSYSDLNQYACDNEDVFTLSLDEVTGNGSSDKNLLAFMHQKHHKILSAKTETIHKQAYKDWLLRDMALDSEQPIYLSYTENDLSLTHDSEHTHAIYYAIGKNQPIGAISIALLNNMIKL